MCKCRTKSRNSIWQMGIRIMRKIRLSDHPFNRIPEVQAMVDAEDSSQDEEDEKDDTPQSSLAAFDESIEEQITGGKEDSDS
jgi:hypothetical protein